MGFLKSGVCFFGAILLLSFFEVGVAADDRAMQMANATSVYQEILANLNQPSYAPVKKSSKAPEKKEVAQNLEKETQQFVDEIRFEIQEFVKFPDSLRGKGYQATVLVEFGLNTDGTIRDLKVNAKEGQAKALFEARALLAVQKASRYFPLVPDRVNVTTLTFKIPIIFQET